MSKSKETTTPESSRPQPPAAIAGVVERLAELHDGLGPAYSTSFRLQLGSLVDQLRAAMKQGQAGPRYELCDTCTKQPMCRDACHGTQTCDGYHGPKPKPVKPVYTDDPAPEPADGELKAEWAECDACGRRPFDWGLIRPDHKIGDQCPCCFLDDYDCDGTLVAIPRRSDAVGEVEQQLRRTASALATIRQSVSTNKQARHFIKLEETLKECADRLAGSAPATGKEVLDVDALLARIVELENQDLERTEALTRLTKARLRDLDRRAGSAPAEQCPGCDRLLMMVEKSDNERDEYKAKFEHVASEYAQAESMAADLQERVDELEQTGPSATTEPHPDAARLADSMEALADRQARRLLSISPDVMRGVATQVRRLQPQPAKVPATIWATLGPRGFVLQAFANRESASKYIRDRNGEQSWTVEEILVRGVVLPEPAKASARVYFEFDSGELPPGFKVHASEMGPKPGSKWGKLKVRGAAEGECCDETHIAYSEVKRKRDQALVDLTAERRAKERAEESSAEQYERAEKAERIIEEDNERLLLAQREINGLRERVAELEKREEEAEDYYDVAAERDRLRERVTELEQALRQADEIRHRLKNGEDCLDELKAPCMVAFKYKPTDHSPRLEHVPGPPEPPRPSTTSGEEIDGSIQQALDNQRGLSEQLDKSFGPVSDVRLRTSGTPRPKQGTGAGPPECHDCTANETAEDRADCADYDPCDVYVERRAKRLAENAPGEKSDA